MRWEYYIVKYSLLFLGWEQKSIEYLLLSPDYHDIALNAHLKAGHLMVRKSFMLYFCGIETKCLPLYTKFATTSGDT